MGVVYRAEHPQLNRSVAIKVLHPGVDRNPEVVHRFFNEAKAATEIRNEHIVEVLDFGELPDGAPYLVMEWLEGQSLGDVLRAQPSLSVARTAAVVHGIAQALRAAHAKGVIHRDLKPDNVFLVKRNGEADFIKVLDFGIAKLMRATDSNRYQTQTGAIIGTPAYMSPEQCRGIKSIDTRTDLYSLGVMAYQMLTGRLPFAADALGELLFKHLSERPQAPASLRPDVPAAFSAIVVQALEKEPDQRPTLDQVVSVMETVIKGSGPVPAASLEVSARADASASAAESTVSAELPAVGRSRQPSPLAAATTLSATATEMGLRPRLPKRRSGRVIAVAIVGVAMAAAAASVIARKASAPARNAAIARAAASKSPASAFVPAHDARLDVRTAPEPAALIPIAPTGRPTTGSTNPAHAGHDVASGKNASAPAVGVTSRDARKRKGSPQTDDAVSGQVLPGYHGSKLKIETDFP